MNYKLSFREGALYQNRWDDILCKSICPSVYIHIWGNTELVGVATDFRRLEYKQHFNSAVRIEKKPEGRALDSWGVDQFIKIVL